MVKKYYEYYKSSFIQISNSDYRSLMGETNEYGYLINLNRISNFDERDTILIKSLGFDIAFSDIDSQKSNYRSSQVCKSSILFKKGEVVPTLIITKIEDEYFIINVISKNDKKRSYFDPAYINEYYKCDQIDGLISCLKDIL